MTAPEAEVYRDRRAWFAGRFMAAPTARILIVIVSAGALLLQLDDSLIGVLAGLADGPVPLWRSYTFLTYAVVQPTGLVWYATASHILLIGVCIEPEVGSSRVLLAAVVGTLAYALTKSVVHSGGPSFVGGAPIVAGLSGLFLGASRSYWRDWGGLRKFYAVFMGFWIVVSGVLATQLDPQGQEFAPCVAALAGLAVCGRRQRIHDTTAGESPAHPTA
jgi:hypothetical protein